MRLRGFFRRQDLYVCVKCGDIQVCDRGQRPTIEETLARPECTSPGGHLRFNERDHVGTRVGREYVAGCRP